MTIKQTTDGLKQPYYEILNDEQSDLQGIYEFLWVDRNYDGPHSVSWREHLYLFHTQSERFTFAMGIQKAMEVLTYGT